MSTDYICFSSKLICGVIRDEEQRFRVITNMRACQFPDACACACAGIVCVMSIVSNTVYQGYDEVAYKLVVQLECFGSIYSRTEGG